MFIYPKSTMEWAAVLGVWVSCTMLWWDRVSGLADEWTFLASVVACLSFAALAFCRRSWRIALFAVVLSSLNRRTSVDQFPGGPALFMMVTTTLMLLVAQALAKRARAVTLERPGEPVR